MGFYCYDCGRDVDGKTLLEERDQWRIKELEAERDTALFDLEFRRDLYKLQEQQLNDVRRERDRLAEALRTLMFNSLRYRMESYDASYQEAEDALAAVKGGSDDN